MRLSDLTIAARAVLLWFTVAGLLLPPAGVLLLVFGHGTARVIGAGLLGAALLHMAVPIGAILSARARKRLPGSRAVDLDLPDEPAG